METTRKDAPISLRGEQMTAVRQSSLSDLQQSHKPDATLCHHFQETSTTECFVVVFNKTYEQLEPQVNWWPGVSYTISTSTRYMAFRQQCNMQP